MKHFSTQDWINFVNQTASSAQHQTMQKHLATGCALCKETVSLWQKVRTTASVEASYQPSAEAVRLAKAVFGMSSLAGTRKESRGLVEVLFDSFLQPALAGTRSAALGIRQMLYRAEPYQIDIQIDAKPSANRIVVTGQILDVSSSRLIADGLQVTLSNCRGNSMVTCTNNFGEFVGEVENSGDLELSISGPGEKPIVVSLRNALGNATGGKS